jgi:hypothetical protein
MVSLSHNDRNDGSLAVFSLQAFIDSLRLVHSMGPKLSLQKAKRGRQEDDLEASGALFAICLAYLAVSTVGPNDKF